ncbi:hypothetical protein PIB30_048315 [Stylosanthes scabra]|uniref:t-SNARE coiled-coil homology domain-containing protein n=1 Tax=Stylosanthes scabra TaxID=79078 RepID=A0ABU6YIR1_9FABA|nr:hypothetical protein [Stylosanthes scabra]
MLGKFYGIDDDLPSSLACESETFLQKAIEQEGRATIMDTIQEIQERHDTVMEIERSPNELHQVFMDMAGLVQSQGEQIDDIESHVARATWQEPIRTSVVGSSSSRLQGSTRRIPGNGPSLPSSY